MRVNIEDPTGKLDPPYSECRNYHPFGLNTHILLNMRLKPNVLSVEFF